MSEGAGLKRTASGAAGTNQANTALFDGERDEVQEKIANPQTFLTPWNVFVRLASMAAACMILFAFAAAGLQAQSSNLTEAQIAEIQKAADRGDALSNSSLA